MKPQCIECERTLEVGETAWAVDVVVVGAHGVRHETRYTCDGCGEPE